MPGRVNASARNRTSGCFLVTAAMTSCQKRTGLVCGLSMRKIVTPASIHRFMMRSTSRSMPGMSALKSIG